PHSHSFPTRRSSDLASRTAVEGMSSASFRHGPLEMVGEQTLLFMVGGEGAERTLNRRLLEDVRLAGGRAEWVGHDADREEQGLLDRKSTRLNSSHVK